MLASFFRGHSLRLTTSQMRFNQAYRSVSIPYRSFSASATLYEEEPKAPTVSDLANLHEVLDAADSNIPRQGLEGGGQEGGQEDKISLNTTHMVTHQLDQHRSGTFWVNYRQFEGGKDELLDAVTRKAILRRLIWLAETQDEWDALQRIFKVWKQHQWGMESVAETALYARATEHSQFALLTYLIKEEMIYFPSRRQARQVVHAIVAPRWGRQLPLDDRLFHLLNFNYVNSDPQIMREKRSQDRFQSVAANDDIVIGSMMLSLLLQAVGEPTFDVSIRRRLSKTALQLASTLAKNWKPKHFGRSGGNPISLTQDEKGWAYLATLECSKALELSSVVEILESDFGPPPERIPNHPIHNVPDWEDPETAIEWPRLIKCLQDVRRQGTVTTHVKHEGWVGVVNSAQLSSTTLTSWKQVFEGLTGELAAKGVKITWVIVEGFVLYWHPEVVSELDVRLFLRGQYDSMKARRGIRGEYQASDGYTWNDPPNYWDYVVWPAYLKAHQHLFVNGDINGIAVECNSDTEFVASNNRGDENTRHSAADLVVLPAEGATLEELVEISCLELKAFQTALIEGAA